MEKSLNGTFQLHNGVKMPYFGLGVYKVQEGEEVVQAVKTALETGYRLIDTAEFYQNEEGVGRAIRESGVPREEIFITTKVWNSSQGYDSTLKAFEGSLKKLGLEYIDLYLIHWPVSGKYMDTWRALERLYKEGLVRAIGVSNFHIQHLENIMNHFEEKPVVNQVELHPYLTQEKLRRFCRNHNIHVESWSPLARGQVVDDPVIGEISKKHGKTPAQIILRWHVQNDLIVIPKSKRPSRIKENADIFDFHLSEEDMNKINRLNKDYRTGSNPDDF
ncbi:aldo/keto reductase [Fervidibacillus halotolerans]|uniref:Aldo/keto reductase n=1 Tax=Fervidibacillus halotolerans TaxID=2980027 RepID=A0A9E8M0K0_9BACI|nr:aldo/keto reductase [Fervidibacillus halotolerans]WAA12966.1 aldo/keto reductase [Fervidibacillus halotolerans]